MLDVHVFGPVRVEQHPGSLWLCKGIVRHGRGSTHTGTAVQQLVDVRDHGDPPLQEGGVGADPRVGEVGDDHRLQEEARVGLFSAPLCVPRIGGVFEGHDIQVRPLACSPLPWGLLAAPRSSAG